MQRLSAWLLAAPLALAGAGLTQEPAQDPAPDAAPEAAGARQRPRLRFTADMEQKAALALAVREEQIHRDRMARVSRIRLLAAELGDQDMREEVERLGGLELRRHQKRLLQAKDVLDPETWQFIHKFVAVGRERSTPTIPPASPEGDDG